MNRLRKYEKTRLFMSRNNHKLIKTYIMKITNSFFLFHSKYIKSYFCTIK